MALKCFGLTPIQYGSSRLTNEIRGERYISFVCLAPGLRESFLVLWTSTTVVSSLVWTRVFGLRQPNSGIKVNSAKVLRHYLSSECSNGDLLHFKPKTFDFNGECILL